jgi:gamma-glutamyltranspeptidase/glutathione hydrolase
MSMNESTGSNHWPPLGNPLRLDRRRALATLATGLAGAATGGVWMGVPAVAQEQPATAPTPSGVATGDRWAVATVHTLATRAAQNAFARGGNAFDAAVAATFMLGVVDGHNSGIGGGCFILARTAAGQFIAIDGRETAPAQAHRDMYLRNGQPDPQASRIGPLASGVPGQVAALAKASLAYGHGGWSAALREAADVATEGYRIGNSTAVAIRGQAAVLKQFPASAAQFLAADGSPPAVGQRLRQPDLGRTLAALADEGPDWFYRGPFAQACGNWMSHNGGLLTAADFATYTAVHRPPLKTSYHDWQVIGFPPPSSGGIHVAQMLMMLEQFPVAALLRDEPATAVHLLAEVMKRAFADRAHWLGDSDYVSVPKGLIDRAYCHELAASIDLNRVTEVRAHGQPPAADSELFTRQHTTHLTAADAAGNWVAITNTVNTTFGSCVVIPGTGVVMNNEMDDFSIAPGTPNAFGLIGAEANAIAPGKRPLSSMSPTIVTDAQENPRLTCGAAGGPRIINAVLQCLIRVLDQGLTVDAALAAPRVHHQWSPDQLLLERRWHEAESGDSAVVTALTERGHRLAAPGSIAVAQALELTAAGELRAASDPRVAGAAAAQ